VIENHRGLIALSSREIARFMKVWTQTLVAPVIASALFVIVFGLSLGNRIREIAGFPYDAYIVPGLIAMSMAQAAYSNNAFSLFQARFDRYLHDVLAAPMRGWEVNLALNIGGAVRALIIGGALAAIAMPITGAPVNEPFVLVLAVLLMLTLFCSLGVVVGIYAETWDHTTFIQTLVIVPLSFLGGVFYSVDSLPSPWQELSHANPIFYLIEAVRYGFLGVSDVSPWLALVVTGAMGAVCVAWSAYLFATGRRLKP
jgi:ABC-2 type transport system permease protein